MVQKILQKIMHPLQKKYRNFTDMMDMTDVKDMPLTRPFAYQAPDTRQVDYVVPGVFTCVDLIFNLLTLGVTNCWIKNRKIICSYANV